MTMKFADEKLKKVGENFRKEIIDLWKTKDSADYIYYTKGETEDWLKPFWAADSVFLKFFNTLDIRSCAEIACGFGRHAAQIFQRTQTLYLVDTSIDALGFARERFKQYPHVKIILSEDGLSMPSIPDHSLTAVFSYDAMVHFEPLTMVHYLAEINRTLMPGGRALLHHSNFTGNPIGTIANVTGARNFMSKELFAHFCSRNGLKVIAQQILDWSFPQSDALTLIEKM